MHRGRIAMKPILTLFAPRPPFLSSPISSNIPPPFSLSITIHIHIERFIVLYRASDANATTRRRFLCKYLFARPPSFPDILSPLPLPERFPERRVGGPVFRKIFRRKVAFYVPFNIHRDCIHSIFRATCAEEGIICLHRSIEIYGSVFLAIIDGWMEFWSLKVAEKRTGQPPRIGPLSI